MLGKVAESEGGVRAPGLGGLGRALCCAGRAGAGKGPRGEGGGVRGWGPFRWLLLLLPSQCLPAVLCASFPPISPVPSPSEGEGVSEVAGGSLDLRFKSFKLPTSCFPSSLSEASAGSSHSPCPPMFGDGRFSEEDTEGQDPLLPSPPLPQTPPPPFRTLMSHSGSVLKGGRKPRRPQCCGMLGYVFICCAYLGCVVSCHMGLLKPRQHVCCVCGVALVQWP